MITAKEKEEEEEEATINKKSGEKHFLPCPQFGSLPLACQLAPSALITLLSTKEEEKKERKKVEEREREKERERERSVLLHTRLLNVRGQKPRSWWRRRRQKRKGTKCLFQ